MSAAALLDGFWLNAAAGQKFHFFLADEERSLCGEHAEAEMMGTLERRRPGGMDCKKCQGIYQELFAAKPPAEQEPDWIVKTDPVEKVTQLLYRGSVQSSSKHIGGDAALHEMARTFNKNGTVPKKQSKARCAADAKNAAKFIGKRAKHSPELPLSNPTENEQLLAYLESLYDESEVGAVAVPPIFRALSDTVEIREELVAPLRWSLKATGRELEELLEHLEWIEEVPGACANERPWTLWDQLFEGRETNSRQIFCAYSMLHFLRSYHTTKSPTPKPMPAKTSNTPTAPAAELVPASHFRRYPTNRTIDAESIENMSVSVRELGILQPIIARPIAGETELEIVAGETRWLGARKIDAEYLVPVFIRDLSDKEAAKIHAVENFQRKDLNAIEEGREIEHMRNCGWELDEIMAHLGRGKDFLYRRIALLKLPPEGQTAFLEGSLSQVTAAKILSLPEEVREEALKSVVSPTHSAKALPERQALELLEREYIEPAKKAEGWSQRRHAVKENHPGAEWLEYEEARKLHAYNSGYVRADHRPNYQYLSDAARNEELAVPTWGELAAKHGAKIVIGITYNDEAQCYVLPDPLVEAEKAACNDNPGDCIFTHEAAVHLVREENEKRKREQEAHRAALSAEKTKLADLVLSPDGLTKTAAKKLVEACFVDCCCDYASGDLSEFASLLGVESAKDEEPEAAAERMESAVTRYLRSKAFTPFDSMARLQLAYHLAKGYGAALVVFENSICKPADFPAHYSDYQELLAHKAKLDLAAAERKDAAAAAVAKEEGMLS